MRSLLTKELIQISGGNPIIDSIIQWIVFWPSQEQQPTLSAVAYTNADLSCFKEQNHSTPPHECTHTSQQA